MEQNYDDIIHLPHPVSKKHKAMSLEMRAAQFAPFAALSGHDEAISETGRQTESLVELEVDSARGLDEKLAGVRAGLSTGHSPTLTVTYFEPDSRKEGGHYTTLTATVKHIDEVGRQLVLTNGSAIPMGHIIDLSINENDSFTL